MWGDEMAKSSKHVTSGLKQDYIIGVSLSEPHISKT